MQPREPDLFAEHHRIAARARAVGSDQLTHAERAFAAIWEMEAQLNNGGFAQWMYNSPGDEAVLAVAALRELGANELADVCEAFFALLPGGTPELDRDRRQAQLEQAEQLGGEEFEDACSALDQRFYALEEDLQDRLWAQVRARSGADR